MRGVLGNGHSYRTQYFSGMSFYEPRPPCDATQIGRFRTAIGEAGVEELLKASIDTAVASKAIKPAEFERVIVDTTVQEKAIAHPVDSRLLEIARHKVVAAAKRCGIVLKQTFAKQGKELRRKAGGYAHAKQFKRLKKVVKRQRTILGIVLREVERKIAQAGDVTAVAIHGLRTIMERAERKRDDDLVFPNAAAIDVGASSHWVAVSRHAADEPVREFGAMTAELNAMADWLISCEIDTVALESTGVYWIPVYEVLEQRGLTVWLVDARQMKYVPGRKSDVQDCQWLQRLMSQGYLRAAFRPPQQVCVVRAVARQRDVLLAEQASWVQRMQKALVQMNIQLTEVLTDVMGMTGQAIIRDIVAGQRDPRELARHRNARVKVSQAQIVQALTGNWREEHLFVLGQALAMYDDIARHLGQCDAKLEQLLSQLGESQVDLGQAPREGSKMRAQFDARQMLANWAGVDLTRINGLGLTAAMKILSELGPDLSHFASVKHFCSWLGLCPGTKISGGKVLSAKTKRSANRVRQVLKMAAMSLSHSDSARGAFYRRLCARAWTSRVPTRQRPINSRAWCISCSLAVKPMSIRANRSTSSSSASAALLLSDAAPPLWAS
jgi:transposase